MGETVVCLGVEAGELDVEALLCSLRLFFCQFVAYVQKIRRDFPSDLIVGNAVRILWRFGLEIYPW